MLLVSFYISFEELFYTFSSLFLGLRIIAYRIAISIVSKIVLIALVLWVLSSSASLGNVLWSHIAAHALQLILIFLATHLVVGKVCWQWNSKGTIDLVRRTWPFLALSILSMLHAKVDTFMLGSLYALAVVAIYEAAYKFLEGLAVCHSADQSNLLSNLFRYEQTAALGATTASRKPIDHSSRARRCSGDCLCGDLWRIFAHVLIW